MAHLEDAKKFVILFQVDFDIGQSEGHKTVKIILIKNKWMTGGQVKCHELTGKP